jgi:hypothetical protein
MSYFFCGKCGKSFYQKSHADAHQRRKTPCDKVKPRGVIKEQTTEISATPGPDRIISDPNLGK